MTRIIYTSYHTNSFKIIKSTFSIYEFPHESVIFLINLGIFNCFENSDRAENFRQTVPIYGWWVGGGGGAVARTNAILVQNLGISKSLRKY